jgi:DNA-binding response OmpR family regulator
VIAVSPVGIDPELVDVTPWVLLVVRDARKLRLVRAAFERAGFGVEVAASVEDAFECLAVMTPALIVIDERLPGSSDLLDRARAVGVEASSDRDAVSQQLA